MFGWLKGSGGAAGLARMTRDLERMIQEGRHAFDAACSVLIGGADPESVRTDLYGTDLRIDKLEQSIRRQIVVHGSVHGAAHMPELMVLMSVAKDAERVGDYAKNLFALSAHRTFHSGAPHHDNMKQMRHETSALLADAPELYETQDKERAQQFIDRASRIIDECEQRMIEIFALDACTGQDAAAILAYRYIRRVGGHIQNVITAVVNPVDKLDFHDEPRMPDAPAG